MCLILGAVYLPDCLLLLNFRLCRKGFSNWFVCIALQHWWSLTQWGVRCVFQSFFPPLKILNKCFLWYLSAWLCSGKNWHLNLLQGAYSETIVFDDPSLLIFFPWSLVYSLPVSIDTYILIWLPVFYCEVALNMKSKFHWWVYHITAYTSYSSLMWKIPLVFGKGIECVMCTHYYQRVLQSI